jgi:acyl-CoA synthetase (AMP-forming)/AMP-acid ligase II
MSALPSTSAIGWSRQRHASAASDGGAGLVATIPQALAYWSAVTPDAVAILTPGREPISYRDLHAAVARLAAGLRSLGLGQHDGIAVLLPEGPELSVALLAAMAVGIAVPLAWPSPAAEYRRIIETQHVRALLVSDTLLASTFAETPVITLVAGPTGDVGDLRLDGRAVGEPCPTIPPRSDDVALILHSSGTTGRPKLVPRLHRNIVANCLAVSRARAATSADRCLSAARSTYSQGFNLLMFTLFSGASLIRAPELDLAALPHWVRAYAPTYISTTPAVLRLLGDAAEALRKTFQHSSLTRIHSSAGFLSADELDWLEEALGLPILNGYGMSEASGIAGELYPRLHRVPGSVGPPWCEITILGETDRTLPPLESGEIVVRGPTVFPGYLDDPDAHAAAFLPDGWFRTGDLGFRDERGYLHLTGRVDEVINRGGEKIVPREVDGVLGAHPAVAEAAVFAVSDARLGQEVVAAVVLLPGAHATPRALRAWMLDRLSPFKAPRRIWLVDRLPRTPTGKVRRSELARRWVERFG